jgi:hypothetical protein
VAIIADLGVEFVSGLNERNMKEQAQIIQLKKQEQETPFICSACGAGRDCDCNAPAVERLAAKHEQDRQRAKAYRGRKAAAPLTAPLAEPAASRDAAVENIDESSKALNAVGKPYGPQYDPSYKLKPPPSIKRLFAPQKNLPMVGDAAADLEATEASAEISVVEATETTTAPPAGETTPIFQPNLDLRLPNAKATAIRMPTKQEADKSEQEALYDAACGLVGEMNPSTRRKFFDFIKRSYPDSK